MDDGEHEYEIELAFQPCEQCAGFVVIPADGWSGTREIRMNGLDGKLAGLADAEDFVGGCCIALQCNDLCARFRDQYAVLAGIGAYVQSARGAKVFDCFAHPYALVAALLRGVVTELGRVLAPVRSL